MEGKTRGTPSHNTHTQCSFRRWSTHTLNKLCTPEQEVGEGTCIYMLNLGSSAHKTAISEIVTCVQELRNEPLTHSHTQRHFRHICPLYCLHKGNAVQFSLPSVYRYTQQSTHAPFCCVPDSQTSMLQFVYDTNLAGGMYCDECLYNTT